MTREEIILCQAISKLCPYGFAMVRATDDKTTRVNIFNPHNNSRIKEAAQILFAIGCSDEEIEMAIIDESIEKTKKDNS